MLKRFLFVLMAALLWVRGPAAGQSQDPLTEGILAFREGEYELAARAFERATEQDPANAEAYYLLARVYYETPLRDDRKSERALEQALELDPDNVQYLVAQLEFLRREAGNFIAERIRDQKRRDLAREILAIDSTNAFAHEELGVTYIHDFWRYRNAVALPNTEFGLPDYKDQNPEVINPSNEAADPENPDPGQGGLGATNDIAARNEGNPFVENYDPGRLFVDDQYDLERLEKQGVPIQDLSARGEWAYERAVGHLNKALDYDPRRRSVYDQLMKIYALEDEPAKALEMLGQMYAYYPEDPDLWFYLGFAHHRAGNLDAAAKSFEEAMKFAAPEEEQAFESIAMVLPDDERRLYEEAPEAYAARFWASKDPRYLTPYNERKLEHYARLVYADLLYGSEDIGMRGWESDRGLILVRYGIPRADVVWIVSGSQNQRGIVNTSQLGSTEVINFGADMVTDANTLNIWDYGDFKFVFEDPLRNGRYRFFSPSADQIAQNNVSYAWQNDYEILARETFRETPERYEYAPPGRQVDLPYLVSTFKGDQQADVYVHYGIPITEYDPSKDVIELTATLGTFLVGDNRDILAERRKTIYGLRTDQIVSFQEANLWVNSQRMDAPPGEHDVSVEFETTSGSTVGVQRRTVEVPDFFTDRLVLSDLLLAYHVEETFDDEPAGASDIVRNGLSITPAPWSVFDHLQPIYLYFEVYNLQQQDDGRTDYEVEAVLAPKDDAGRIEKLFRGIFGGGEKGVGVRLPVQGNLADDGQYLILDATNQEPGLYTLVLRVTDQLSGRTVESEQDLFLE